MALSKKVSVEADKLFKSPGRETCTNSNRKKAVDKQESIKKLLLKNMDLFIKAW